MKQSLPQATSSFKSKLDISESKCLNYQLSECMKIYVPSIQKEDIAKLFKREKFICIYITLDEIKQEPCMYAFCHDVSKINKENEHYIANYLYDAPMGVVLGEIAGDSRKHLFVSDIYSVHHIFY